MEITRKDVGYTIYSRLEESLRNWIAESLIKMYGEHMWSHIPRGHLEKVNEKGCFKSLQELEDPRDFLEELEFIEICEIIYFEDNYTKFIPNETPDKATFQDIAKRTYELRNKIAHVKRSFSAIDLDMLIDLTYEFIKLPDFPDEELRQTLDCIKTNPEKIIVKMPSAFQIDDTDEISSKLINNLPQPDYQFDGGFVGRRDDVAKVRELLLGQIHRVVTISGAGGVGKTALAFEICESIVNSDKPNFDVLVWMSAKEEELTAGGIEPLEPTFRNYENVIDTILTACGWKDYLNKSPVEKEEGVKVIVQGYEKGILLVVDNLETVRDDRIIEFLKDFPPPSKVLITSRIGLGEVERRYPLKELTKSDAIVLFRTVSREKGLDYLVKLPDEIIDKYTAKLSRYPLAMKWVIGQVALGLSINQAVDKVKDAGADIAKFCFDQIYNDYLDDDCRMVLSCLCVSDVPLRSGVLAHISKLPLEQMNEALRKLTVASLIISEHQKTGDGSIETSYRLLPLTRGYLQNKLESNPEKYQGIVARLEEVERLSREVHTVGIQYKYSLQDLGARTHEERLAAMYCTTAYQKSLAQNYDGARESFKRATEIAPDFPGVYRNWAVVEQEWGHFQTADDLMKKAIGLSPKDPRLWFTWGTIALRRTDFDKAAKYFQEALKLAPEDGPIYGALGDVERRRGNYEKADEYLKKALSCPYTIYSKRHDIMTYSVMADNLRRWAEVYKNNRQYKEERIKLEKALEYAEKATKLSPEDILSKLTLSEVLLNLGLNIYHNDGFISARPFLERAIIAEPQSFRQRKQNIIIVYYLTKGFFDLGKFEAVLELCRRSKEWKIGQNKFSFSIEKMEKILADRHYGVVIRINEVRGFGIIEMESKPGQTVMFHYSDVVPKIEINEICNLMNKRLSCCLFTRNDNQLGANIVRLET